MADAPNLNEFARLIDLSDLEKLTAAKRVATMIDTPAWALVVRLLEDRKVELTDTLIRHKAVKTEAEYARDLAELRGYGKATDVVQTVLHVAEQAAVRLSEAEGGT